MIEEEDDDENLLDHKLVTSDSKIYGDRVILHIDQDCFYCQVESVRNPNLKGQPLAVVQYDPKGDLRDISEDENRILKKTDASIIAVNYEAKRCGVKRQMRAIEAQKLCKNILLVTVPLKFQKTDLSIYNKASDDIVHILQEVDDVMLEKTSCDESYLDVTIEAERRLENWRECLEIAGNSKVNNEESAGYQNFSETYAFQNRNLTQQEKRLICGAAIAAELRKNIFRRLGYECSCGIASNKLLAKLGSDENKPNQQTLILPCDIPGLLKNLKISKLKNGLGGKRGVELMEDLKIEKVGELVKIDSFTLIKRYGNNFGLHCYNLSRGIDNEVVKNKTITNSITWGKTFRGKTMLQSFQQIESALEPLIDGLLVKLVEDYEKNNRIATSISHTFHHLIQIGKPGEKEKVRRCSQLIEIPSFLRSKEEMKKVIMKSFLKKIRYWYESENLMKRISVTLLELKAVKFQQAYLKGAKNSLGFAPSSICSQERISNLFNNNNNNNNNSNNNSTNNSSGSSSGSSNSLSGSSFDVNKGKGKEKAFGPNPLFTLKKRKRKISEINSSTVGDDDNSEKDKPRCIDISSDDDGDDDDNDERDNNNVNIRIPSSSKINQNTQMKNAISLDYTEEIDHDVLMELPEKIRSEILNMIKNKNSGRKFNKNKMEGAMSKFLRNPGEKQNLFAKNNPSSSIASNNSNSSSRNNISNKRSSSSKTGASTQKIDCFFEKQDRFAGKEIKGVGFLGHPRIEQFLKPKKGK